MIRWPSLAPAGPTPAEAEPIDLSLDEATRPLGAYAPSPEDVGTADGRGAASLAVIPRASAPDRPPARAAWNMLALAASLAAHVALAAALGYAVMRDGVEADSEAISVEIVVEPIPDDAPAPSVAGEGGEAAEAVKPAEAPQRVPAESPAAIEPVTPDVPQVHDLPEAPPTATEATDPVEPEAAVEDPVEATAAELPPPASTPEIAATDIVPQFAPLDPPSLSSLEDEAEVHPVEPEPAGVAMSTTEMTAPLDTREEAPPVLAAAPSLVEMLPPIAMPAPPRLPDIARNVAPQAAAPPRAVSEAEKPATEKPATRKRSVEKPRAEKTISGSTGPKKTKPAETATRKADVARKPDRTGKGAVADKRGAAKKAETTASKAGGAASSKASAGALESYGRAVNRHVQRYKRYPGEAAKSGMKGAVRLSISIGGSGNLAGARVTGSSGHALLDSEALATVRRAAPYPRPPAGAKAQFSLTLRYSR